MEISITPKLAQKIEEKVLSGIYTSTAEVINEALRLLDERDTQRMRDFYLLQQDIKAGFDSGGMIEMDVTQIINNRQE